MSCGTRAQDLRPGDPDGVRLLRSSLVDQLLAKRGTAYCWYCRTSRCARRQPTPSPRYRSPTSLPGTATAVLLMAAPDHCGPPGPAVSPVAVLQQPWLRNSTTAPSCVLQLRSCCPAVRVCRSCCLSGLREKP